MRKVFSWIIGIGVTALAVIIEGCILNVLWDWFMIPLGLASISVAHAIGLATLGGLITHQYNPRLIKPHTEMTEDERIRSVKHLFTHLFVRPVIILLTGWIAHFYM